MALPPARRRALVAALLSSCFLAGTAAAAPAAPATVAVVARELPQAFAAEATVEAVKQATVGAQATGRVVELAVKAGDAVRAGQLIARIDAREADQAVAASLSQVAEAEANLANAKRVHERNRELVAQKFVSQAALDQSEASYKAAQAQVAALKAAAGQAATQRSFATVVAPFAGVVGATHVEAGDLATAGRPLATVFVPGDLRVTATLPQAALARWKRELPVAVELPVLNRSVTAVRATVVPIADTRTHTVKVRLDLPAAEGLLPGQFARARFPTGTVRALAVPPSALLRRGEVTAVYVLDKDGRALLRQVRTGDTLVDPKDGAVVEILSGLAAGERIAANPVAAGLGAAP
jgi:RND family efflux transporter MFP subunit